MFSISAGSPGNKAVTASTEQLAMLDKGMLELEEMLKEIEEVSAILEFNSSSEAGGTGSGRGLFRAAGNGASVLAAQVGEDLRKWHEANEINVVKFGADHARRLQKAVDTEKEDQESHERVRMVVRRRLYQLSNDSIRAGVAADVSRQAKMTPEEKKHDAGASIVAVTKLESRLKAITEPVFSLRGEYPQEMLSASYAAGAAVDLKRRRGQGRRARLPEVQAHLDSELLDKSEQLMGQRRLGLYQQYERQVKVLTQLEAAQEDRLESSEAFEAMTPSRPARSSDGKDFSWSRLCPTVAEGLPDSLRSAGPSRWRQAVIDFQQGQQPPLPALSSAVEESLVEALYPLVMRQGENHIRNMRAEFHQNYLAKDSSERARQVQGQLERWQLRCRLELLQSLCNLSEDSHNQVMRQLNTILSFKDSDPGDHLEKTLSAAEDFHRQREDFFDSHSDRAADEVQAHCRKGLVHLQSIRRRMELACLKRWADVENGLEIASDAAWVACQTQLASDAARLVNECVSAVSLEIGDLDTLPAMTQVEVISVAWRRCGTQIPGMIKFLEKITQGLPDTMATCAVAKAALMLVEQELYRIIEKLSSRSRA